MKLNDALEQCWDNDAYNAIKHHLSLPELLDAAAIQCFLYPPHPVVSNTIREALLHLRTVGTIPKN